MMWPIHGNRHECKVHLDCFARDYSDRREKFGNLRTTSIWEKESTESLTLKWIVCMFWTSIRMEDSHVEKLPYN